MIPGWPAGRSPRVWDRSWARRTNNKGPGLQAQDGGGCHVMSRHGDWEKTWKRRGKTANVDLIPHAEPVSPPTCKLMRTTVSHWPPRHPGSHSPLGWSHGHQTFPPQPPQDQAHAAGPVPCCRGRCRLPPRIIDQQEAARLGHVWNPVQAGESHPTIQSPLYSPNAPFSLFPVCILQTIVANLRSSHGRGRRAPVHHAGRAHRRAQQAKELQGTPNYRGEASPAPAAWSSENRDGPRRHHGGRTHKIDPKAPLRTAAPDTGRHRQWATGSPSSRHRGGARATLHGAPSASTLADLSAVDSPSSQAADATSKRPRPRGSPRLQLVRRLLHLHHVQPVLEWHIRPPGFRSQAAAHSRPGQAPTASPDQTG